MTSQLTVATWNTHGKATPRMLDLLREVRPDVLFLQEVKSSTWPLFQDGLGEWTGACGLDLRGEGIYEGGKRALGAALLVRAPLTLSDPSTVQQEDFAWAERGVTGLVTPVGTASPIRLVSYHALHGGHGTIKPATSQALADWLAEQKGPVLLGMDANSPDVDHPDESKIECCWAQPDCKAVDRALLGPTPERAHALSDVWRTYLTHHEQELGHLRASAPTGPLATTHYTGSGATRRPRRYDSIWASPEFTVEDVNHMQAGFDAGADHALVVARLDL